MMSAWYRRLFPTRLALHRQAVQEFVTTAQGYRLATSNGGVLTGRGADIILIDDPLKPEEALSDAQRQAANDWFDHTLYSRQNDKQHGAIVTQLVNRSAKADLKAIQILLTMLRDIESRADPGSADPAAFTEADQQIIQRIRARLRGEKDKPR